MGEFNIFRGGLGFKVPHLSHPDSPRLDALAHALGGGESSLFWERLRNQQNLVNYRLPELEPREQRPLLDLLRLRLCEEPMGKGHP